jgi:hypothetical protein
VSQAVRVRAAWRPHQRAPCCPQVAIKIIKKSAVTDEKIIREICIMRMLEQ